MLSNLIKPGTTASVILCLAVILFAGFLLTRITKKCKLPNVTGYIFAGIILGPYVLGVIPTETIAHMDFVTDIALAFIAFGVGKYFKLATLKQSGKQAIIVTLFESLMAAAVIALVMIFVFRLPVGFSILLGAIGCATAPASTIMTIRQYKAKGDFVHMVMQVVALDDAVALIAFSVCAAIAQGLAVGHMSFSVVILPVIYNILALGLGWLCGFALSRVINEKRSSDHRLVLSVAIVLALTGFCSAFDISPLLACMVMGATYVNIKDDETLFDDVNAFTPPILLCFFVLSGMKLNVPSLVTAGVIGVAYFIVRIVGKYAGASLGAAVAKSSAPIKKYLGMCLVPQAGVSIGLAALGQRLLPADMGMLLSTIILSSAVLYEMMGPACSKAGLILSGAIPREELEKNDGARRERSAKKAGGIRARINAIAHKHA
nr:cation:proton antiporter [Maliibacterium massiliense]